MKKILFQGAEATISKNQKAIIKDRVEKKYRYPELDTKIRRMRTKKENKLLEKAANIIFVPKVIECTEYTLKLEEIKGKRLADSLDKLKNKSKIAQSIGKQIAKMHDAKIIHGDLTTSNMLQSKDTVYFIDFGLGYESSNIEDKAVDLHVLKEALVAKHPKSAQEVFAIICRSYVGESKNAKAVMERLKIVEKRGRYKEQY